MYSVRTVASVVAIAGMLATFGACSEQQLLGHLNKSQIGETCSSSADCVAGLRCTNAICGDGLDGGAETGSADGAPDHKPSIVLIGGRGEDRSSDLSNPTWEWDGTSWTKHQVEGDRPSIGVAAMAPLDGKVVLIGDDGLTWLWDGERWTKRDLLGPGMRRFHLMVTVGKDI